MRKRSHVQVVWCRLKKGLGITTRRFGGLGEGN